MYFIKGKYANTYIDGIFYSKGNEIDIFKQADKLASPEALEEQFKQDTKIVAEQSAQFVKELHPAKRPYYNPVQYLR